MLNRCVYRREAQNVNQKYLGSADALLKLKTQSSAPPQDTALYSHIESYGDVVLLYDLLPALGSWIS